MAHAANWYAGWMMILIAFVIGAALGLFFHHPHFLGGYSSWRRRLTRLGHIALAALGLMNVVYGLSPAAGQGMLSSMAGVLLIAGGVAMPLVCFLSAWKQLFKALFAIPVSMLCAAVVLILLNGLATTG